MANVVVTITEAGFNPDPVDIQTGDTITWTNNTQQVQEVSGPTFVTGQIQPATDSLPIVFDFADPHINYTSNTGVAGVVAVSDPVAFVHWPQIRALFTAEDVQHMLPFGLDLSDKNDVCSQCDDILDRVTRTGAGRMPPPPRPKWSDENVGLLRTWKQQGCPD